MYNKGPPVTLCPQSYHQGGFGLLFPLFPRPQSLLRRGSPHKGHRGWVVFCRGPARSAVNSVSVTWPFWYLGHRPKTGPLLPHQLPRDRMEFPQVPGPTLSKGALISGDLHMEGHLHHWYTLLASLPFGVCPRLPVHSSFSLIRKSEVVPFAACSSRNHEAPEATGSSTLQPMPPAPICSLCLSQEVAPGVQPLLLHWHPVVRVLLTFLLSGNFHFSCSFA